MTAQLNVKMAAKRSGLSVAQVQALKTLSNTSLVGQLVNPERGVDPLGLIQAFCQDARALTKSETVASAADRVEENAVFRKRRRRKKCYRNRTDTSTGYALTGSVGIVLD